jgi:hypothetical protein
LPIYGFFVIGVFSGHAVYLPELFPTHVRATAVSFCNGTGRSGTGTGPLTAVDDQVFLADSPKARRS